MKRITTFLLFALTISLYAQTEHMVATTSYSWNNSNMTWNASSRVIINYCDNDLRSEDFILYPVDGGWGFGEYSVKQAYVYNGNNDLQEQINSMWTNGAWNPVWSYNYTYFGNGEKETSITKSWNGTEWENYSRFDFTYESDKIITIYSEWNNDSWEQESKTESELNANGQISISYFYYLHDGTWDITNDRIVYTYNSNNDMLTQVNENLVGGSYQPSVRQLKEYDSNYNMTLWANQVWNSTYQRWDDQYKSTYTYNSNNQRTGHLSETWGGYFWTNASKTEYEYSTATDIEDNSHTVTDFHLANNYPNPFNPTTNISFSLPVKSNVLLTVHNIAGERVATLAEGEKIAGTYKVEFNGNGLASGMYFYKLETDGFVEVKKMMLLK